MSAAAVQVVRGPVGPIAPSLRPSHGPGSDRASGARKPASADEYAWMKGASASRRLAAVMNTLVAAERGHLLSAQASWGTLQRDLARDMTALSTTGPPSGSGAPDVLPSMAPVPGVQLQDMGAAERLGDYLYYSGRPLGADSVVYYRQRVPLATGVWHRSRYSSWC